MEGRGQNRYRAAGAGLLLVSGFAALVYETAWTRVFEALLGHTAGTTATVIAGFLGGLALGSGAVARVAPRLRRPLRIYGLVELGAAAWVVVLPWVVRGVDGAGSALLGSAWAAPGPGDLLRWAAGFILVLLPATALGASFPLVVAGTAGGTAGEGRMAGLLYGANTAGAVAGTVAAGFWTIRHLGVQTTLLLGALAGASAGLGGLLLSNLSVRPPGDRPPARPPAEAFPTWWITTVLVVSGMASLADEVLWLRLFVFPLGGNLSSFATVVGTLLAAVAAGSWLGARMAAAPRRSWLRLAWAELALGAGALMTLAGFSELRSLLWEAGRTLGVAAPLAGLPGRALVVAVLVGLPGLAMGAILPLAVAAGGTGGSPGKTSALAYGALSAGNVAGALAAGYLLLPALGITRAAGAMAGLSLALGAVMLAAAGARRTALAAGVLSAALLVTLVPLSGPGVVARVAAVRDPHAELLAAVEGVQGTVTVSQVPGLPVMAENRRPQRIGPYGFPYRLVAVDAVQVAGDAPDLRTTQRLQAHVPLLVHGRPRTVLQIGYGSGETAAEALLHHSPACTVVELNPDVVEVAHRWFPEFVRSRLTFRFTDAKLAVRTAARRWDVILNDSTYPGMAGSSQLYSLEHFQACRDHLQPGGVVSTWVPVDLPPETFCTVLATFSRVFPRCSFWLAPVCLNKHGVLVGAVDGDDPMEPVPEAEWSEGVRRSLEQLGVSGARALAACRVLDAAGIRRLAGGAPVNSDDRPLLEFPARGLRVSGMDLWAETLDLVLDAAGPPVHGKAVRAMLAGQRALLAGEPDRALDLYRQAAADWPGSPWPGNLTQGILVQRADAEFRIASAALARGDESAAAVHLRRAAKLAPDSTAANAGLGRFLLRRGRWAEAVSALEAALSNAADPASLELPLADALRFAGDPARAERLYRRALQRSGPGFELLAALSDAVDRQGRLGEAVALMRRAVELDPEREEGIAVLAGLLARAGDRAEARDLLRRFLMRHPDGRRARKLLLRLQSEGGGGSSPRE